MSPITISLTRVVYDLRTYSINVLDTTFFLRSTLSNIDIREPTNLAISDNVPNNSTPQSLKWHLISVKRLLETARPNGYLYSSSA